MIWDRFDDAHDDLLRGIRDNKNKVDELKGRLDKAGITYKPYEALEPRNEPGPQGWYEDTQREELSLAAYESYLRGLLKKAPK